MSLPRLGRNPRDGDARPSLDGVHLVRFGQLGGTGGLSAHLEALDDALARRFAITIYRLAAGNGAADRGARERRRVGHGELVRVGLAGPGDDSPGAQARGAASWRGHLRRLGRRLALAGTLGHPGAGDWLRRLYGGVVSLPLLPEMLPVTRWLPVVGGEARRLAALRESVGQELDRVVAEAGADPVLFVSHLPERADALVALREAWRRAIPAGFVHHTGRTPKAALLFARSRALARAGGAVSLRGVADLLGRDAVELGNGVDTDFFDRDRAAPAGAFRAHHPEIRPGALLVLVPGKLCERKRQHDVLRACAWLRAEGSLPEFQVVLIGAAPDPGYRERLAAEIRRPDLARTVVIVDHLAREALRRAYRDADVGVLASSLEGQPRVLLEMGAMGVPVVATDAGGSRDTLLPGESGLLVPVGDWRRLAGAIGELLRDPERRARFGKAGAAHVREHHRVDLLVDRHVRFYLEILRPRGGSRGHVEE